MAARKTLEELVDASWVGALEPARAQLATMGDFLCTEAACGRGYLPEGKNVLRAFTDPISNVRVLIVGQDPYPTPGHSIGLAFAVDNSVRPLPRSLQNIYRELRDDLGIVPPEHGDLTSWSKRGVMLLNRVLTVQPGMSSSHRGKGWERFTEQAIRALVSRGGPLVAILWGREAATLKPLLGSTPVLMSAHPSPLSAQRGFFGSKPFSRANKLLVEMGSEPIDWALASIETRDC